MTDYNFTLRPMILDWHEHELRLTLRSFNNTKVQMFFTHDNNPIPYVDDMLSFEGMFYYSGTRSFFITGIVTDENGPVPYLHREFKISRILAIMHL